MRRFFFSLTFCSFLLLSAAFIFSAASNAKEDVVSQLLKVPAPPPPNPLVPPRQIRSESFFSKRRVPPDDAPIRELMDYWRYQSAQHSDLRYTPTPTPRVMDRLRAEIAKDPTSVTSFLNIFRDSADGAEFVRNLYENWPPDEKDEEREKETVEAWLSTQSPQFVSKLEKAASRAGDRGEYVANHEQLLTLAKHDWDAARPTVDRLYADGGQPTSRVMAMWALYAHSLKENSLGDIDRYRDELKAVVEDKKATPGMRDLAFDALVKEKEWSGRDEWYYTLLEDETLADLRVNGSSYTGLTTLILSSHPDKYADKMIELVRSTNPVVRRAAARNLGVLIDEERPDIIKALLPWLEDPKWAIDTNASRQKLIQALQKVKVPESVPALINLLDEKETYYINPNSNAASNVAFNALANAANAIANAANMAAGDDWESSPANHSPYTMNGANNASNFKGKAVTHYPRRSEAVNALRMQEDIRAVPALRRILGETERYEKSSVIRAILHCKGYTVAEQANALETLARISREQMARVLAEQGIDAAGYTANTSNGVSSNVVTGLGESYSRGISEIMGGPKGVDFLLGSELLQISEPGDPLVREIIARMTLLEKREPEIAQAMRGFLLMWKGAAVNSLLLKDLKDGKSEVYSIVKMLSIRRVLQERHAGEISDAAKAGQVPAAIAACLRESEDDYAAILKNEDAEAKAAMFGCARLIRAKLPIKEVAKSLSHQDKRLIAAAESYLESEDSQEARNIVLSLHPNDAKVMGATTGFWPEARLPMLGLSDLFDSVSGNSSNASSPMLDVLTSLRGTEVDKSEKPLREEIKKDADLVGLYSYQDNVVRIYKTKITYEWGIDPSRFHERTLSKEEFDEFTGFLAAEDVDNLAPFLDCEEYCDQNELLMLGKSGGRRVFVTAKRLPDFFVRLAREFEVLRQGTSKLKYRLEKDVPGLEILLAEEGREAMTVWSSGGDIRVVVGDAAKRRAIEKELEAAGEAEEDEEESGDEESYYGGEKMFEEQQRRRFDSLAWFTFEAGRLGGPALQPPDVEFIPVRDSLAVTAERERWKTKAAGVEFRLDGDALHKFAGGKLLKVKDGNYISPVITANGKWLFVSKYSDNGIELVRINVATNREFPFKSDKFPAVRAIAFVASTNKILASPIMSEDYEDHSPGRTRMFWIDPDTGVAQLANGEFSPLEQQTFRPLQAGPGPNEFWATMPKENATQVGIYSTRTFSFKPVLTVPKIRFDSMDMWVDQARDKVLFVYNGHLLSLPLTPKK